VKRRLRAIARLAEARPGWDLVLIARAETARTDYGKLREAVESLLVKASLLDKVEKDNERPGARTD
jgi:ribonuclease P protein component